MIDDIKIKIENINNEINQKPKEEYKIVFVGDSGVGSKTSFINRMATGVFNPDTKATNGGSYTSKTIYSKNGNSFKLNIWDTPGQERYKSLTKIFYSNADCIVLGYDITREESYEKINKYWYRLSKENSDIN